MCFFAWAVEKLGNYLEHYYYYFFNGQFRQHVLLYDITFTMLVYLFLYSYTMQFHNAMQSQPYFHMCISVSQLIRNIGIAVFAGMAALTGIAGFTGIVIFAGLAVLACLRYLNIIITSNIITLLHRYKLYKMVMRMMRH